MGPRHTIVIPYTNVKRVHTLLLRFLATPPRAGSCIELRRMVPPGVSRADLSEQLFSEFRALQTVAESRGHQIKITLNRPVSPS